MNLLNSELLAQIKSKPTLTYLRSDDKKINNRYLDLLNQSNNKPTLLYYLIFLMGVLYGKD